MNNWLATLQRSLNRPEARQYIVATALLLLLLAVSNITVTSTDGWAKAFWITFGYAGFYVIYRLARLRPADTALAKANLKTGLRYFAICAGIVGLALIIASLFDSQIFKDPRYDTGLSNALLLAFVLIPLKTVLFEELAFRGLLLGLLFKLSGKKWTATLVSSVLFGIWHMRSAGSIGDYNVGGNLVISQPFVICAVLMATTAAGVIFCLLRWRSQSLLAPIGAHWAINSFAILIAALVWR